MKSYLEKVITELPGYLSQFISCLLHPKRFVTEKLAATDASPAFEKSVAFIVTSFLISLFLSYALPEVTSPLKVLPANENEFIRTGSEALLMLFYLVGACAIAMGFLKLFGKLADPHIFFTLVFYFCGCSLVLLVFANAISNIAMADPFFAKAWIESEKFTKAFMPQIHSQFCSIDLKTGNFSAVQDVVEKSPEFKSQQEIYLAAMQRTLPKIAFVMQAFVALVALLWLLKAWFSYTTAAGVGTGKSIAIIVLTAVAVFVVSLLVSMINAGILVSSIMRNCPT
ncbi:hypothetical protein GCM10011613_28140 [Cellvibrio zantedeschiae]|uniref:Yip1 domain-containing protein n=1 Tax=Cellvibrio zantedeschiae TaxID=1237077 RepID=A0ABQ3B767_9GAMM|nr:hypothetical protein [Cellvibrio zantedeschiae]GGY81810.1 hypothetical protein GCM10011613_28140 [Cellvibrio zantedeschiae]